MKDYDVVIIGAGPGGYVSALRLAQLGKRVALVEKAHLGGTCLNYGCIPTKALIAGARVADTLKDAQAFGFSIGEVGVDYAKAVDRSRAVVSQLTHGVGSLMKRHHVDVYNDRASLKSGHVVSTTLNGDLRAGAIIIATGSSPRKLGVLDGLPHVMSAQEALLSRELPKRLAIIGAGVIGIEFAYLFSAYGCEVTMIEALDRVLNGFDPELSEFTSAMMARRGVTVHTGMKLTAAAYRGGENVLTCVGADGKAVEVVCDSVLCSVGVKPNTEGLGLEKALVQTDERGFIKTDRWMRTSVPSIYAIGDVNGKLPLAHSASAQGICAANCICGIEADPVVLERVPRCVYCEPEIACVGLDERTAKERGREIRTGRFSIGGNGKALADNTPYGFVKVVADGQTGEILGVQIAGPHAGELIAQCEAMMRLEMTAEEMIKAVAPHPSLTEALWEAVNDAAGQAIHK